MKFPMKTAFQPSVLPTVEPCLHPSRTDREGIINGRRCYGRYRAVKKVGKQAQAESIKTKLNELRSGVEIFITEK